MWRYAESGTFSMPLVLKDLKTQRESLRALAELAERGITDPKVVFTARAIVQSCGARDDDCELQAIFDAVKKGDPKVKSLKNGFRYVADPNVRDWFVGPRKALDFCEAGVCGGDCDEFAALVAALTSAIGFHSGVRAWGPDAKGFSHVYAVVCYPKRRPNQIIGLDPTVDYADVGWEPPGGRRLTALIDPPQGWRTLARSSR
jgi:hypothetical protein